MIGTGPSPGATIELFYFDAGGGHRNAMMALSEALAGSCPDWNVKPVNLQKLHAPVDPIFLAAGIPSEMIYNKAIQHGWTRASGIILRGLQRGIQIHAPVMERKLAMHWRANNTSLVVSLIPNFNAIMFRALRRVHPDVPYVTIMTDLADLPPHFWQEPQDQYLICGSDKASLQAHFTGWYRPERIIKTSGMILKPSFYQPAAKPAMTRASLGLDPHKTTALIMFGGNGSRVSRDIILQIAQSNSNIQTIVMCGRDEQLRESLRDLADCHAAPFTDRVADYMRLADFFIGKPGPGSISEALHIGLPVIVENNARTLIQERYNAIWLEEKGVGLALQSFSDLDVAISYLMRDDTLASYKARASSMANRALFEIPQILRSILEECSASDEGVQARWRDAATNSARIGNSPAI